MSRNTAQALAGPHGRDLSAPLHQVEAEKPRWDAANNTLWWGSQVVKQFKGMAPGQVAILAAFEEAGWAACLPVSQLKGRCKERKQWLRDTVKNLNRSVRPHLHFCQERSGTYLRWSPAQVPATGGSTLPN